MLKGVYFWLAVAYIIQISALADTSTFGNSREDDAVPSTRHMWQLLGCQSTPPPRPHMLHRQHQRYQSSISACLESCSNDSFAFVTPLPELEKVKCSCESTFQINVRRKCLEGDELVYALQSRDGALDIHDFVFLIEHNANRTDPLVERQDEVEGENEQLWWRATKWIGRNIWTLAKSVVSSGNHEDRSSTSTMMGENTTTGLTSFSTATSASPPPVLRMNRRSRLPPPSTEQDSRLLYAELLEAHTAIREILDQIRIASPAEYMFLLEKLHDSETELALVESRIARSSDITQKHSRTAKAKVTELPAILARTLEFIDDEGVTQTLSDDDQPEPTPSPANIAESGQAVQSLGSLPPITSTATPAGPKDHELIGRGLMGWYQPLNSVRAVIKRNLDTAAPIEETIATCEKQINLLRIYIGDTMKELDFATATNADQTMMAILETKLMGQQDQLATVQSNLEAAMAQREQAKTVRGGIAFLMESN